MSDESLGIGAGSLFISAMLCAASRLPRVGWLPVGVPCLLLILNGALPAQAVTLAPVFADHMVIQAHRPVPVWGAAAPGEHITVELGGQARSVKASDDGEWRVTLDPFDYVTGNRGQTLVVRGVDELRLEDVLIGEVWLAVAPPDLETWAERRVGPPAPDNLLRPSAGLSLAAPAHLRIWSGQGGSDARWQPATADTVMKVSAIAQGFARHVHTHLDVPVGIIDLSEVGASVLAYLPGQDIEELPTEQRGQPATDSAAFLHRESLYRERIWPLAPFAVRGAIWSHAEADLADVEAYSDWLIAVIARWRADFEQLELPFLIAQAPGAPRGEAWIELRNAQARAAGEVFGAWSAITVDLGDCHAGPESRLHEIGERLGRLARARVYDQTVPEVGGPLLARTEVQPGRVLAHFNHVAGGLVASDRELRHFELLDETGQPVRAAAELTGPRTVAVLVPEGMKPTGLRFGWLDCFEPTLRNAYGQPAAPFRVKFGTPQNLDPKRWARTINVFTRQDRLRMPPPDAVLAIGSSSIRGWHTLARDFPHLPTINRGFGGSLASDAVYYFDQIVRPYRPRLIVFYSGENDIAVGRSAADVASAFAEFCEKTHAELPATRIVFLAMKPSLSRRHLWPAMNEGNTMIEAYCEGDPRRVFVDTASPLLDPEGHVRSELFYDDALHLNAAGYRAWVETLLPVLQ